MFDQFITRPFHLTQHREGPYADERRRFIEHLSEEGRSFHTLKHATALLLSIARLIPADRQCIDRVKIEAAAERWLAAPPRDFSSPDSRRKAKNNFIFYAKSWLRFLGRLDEHIEPTPFQSELESFVQFQELERELSPGTVSQRRRHVGFFLEWFALRDVPLRTVTVEDVSLFLRSAKPDRWQRSTIAVIVDSLRSFFRFAEMKSWCAPGLAAAIDTPRVYTHEHLPQGPRWDDVARLLVEPESPSSAEIRDRAILLLHAIYAFRNSEVRLLRLDDIDWQQETIRVTRPKQRKSQCYPLVPEVGDAILKYLREARPKTRRREVFLSLVQPYRPLTAGGVYSMVRSRQCTVGLALTRYGPHSLRHACATRLLADGFSLKEIGDHLGHASTEATQIYAKVGFSALRQVADLDLAGLADYAAATSLTDRANSEPPRTGGRG